MKDLIKLLDKNLKYTSHEIMDGCLYIKIASRRSETKCPFCGEMSCKVHSTYKRSYQDLPIQGMKVIQILDKRKMLCQNQECVHTTISERFDFSSGK